MEAIPLDAAGRRHIDLFVVTHIDHDRIGEVQLRLEDVAVALTFGHAWFNAPPRRRVRGVAEGEALAKILGASDVTLPWNAAWWGEPVAMQAEGGRRRTDGHRPAADLGPVAAPPDRLGSLYAVWAKELERRGIAGPLPLDAVKLSRHGSRANVACDFLQAIGARHFVFRTNNRCSRHPNAEAVAKVIIGSHKPTRWFNDDTPLSRQWGDEALCARYGQAARYAETEDGRVVLELPARHKDRVKSSWSIPVRVTDP